MWQAIAGLILKRTEKLRQIAREECMVKTPRYWYESPPTRGWRRYRLPLTWEAVVVEVGLLAAFGTIHALVDERRHVLLFFGLILAVLLVYSAIHRWKGEPKRRDLKPWL